MTTKKSIWSYKTIQYAPDLTEDRVKMCKFLIYQLVRWLKKSTKTESN